MAEKFRICPECGTRNKVKWELCVACSASLDDVAVDTGGEAAASVEAPAEGSPLAVLWLVGGLAAAAGAFWYFSQRTDSFRPDAPSSAFFTAPTLPPSARPATPPPSTLPGQDKFEEGRRRLSNGDYAGAAALLAEAAAEAPEDARIRHLYGVALLRSSRREEAIGQLETAVRGDPNSGPYRADLARALASAGRRADAVAEFERASALQPQDVLTLRELAAAYTAAGQKDRSLEVLRRAAAAAPADMQVMAELGQALEDMAQDQAAVDLYREVLGRVPDATLVRSRLAETLYRQGKPEDAVAAIRDGLDRSPQSAVLQRGLGGLLERLGRGSEAALAYREYVRLAPNAADARALEERAARLARQAANPSS